MSNKFRIAVRKFGPFETATEKIWKSFCKETGCTLELEAIPMDLHPLYEATLGQENGLVNGDWDVTHINTDWITEANEKEALEDLVPYINSQKPEGFPEGWSDALLKLQEFDNRIYGLPFHDGPECLIFRKDLFNDPKEKEAFHKKFNRALSPPKTWEELHQIARFFHRPQENLYGTAFALYPDGHNTVFDFSLQLWARAGTLLDAEGKVDINTPQALEGLEFYRKILKDETAVHPKCKEFDSVQAGMAFANGEIAMMVNWFGFASMCEVLPDSKVKGKVDITTIPAGSKGKGKSLSVYWVYGIGKGSKNKSLAYDFIRFATNVENDKLLTLTGGIGCRNSTWYDKEVNETVPYYHKLDELHKNVGTLPQKGNWNDIAKIIDEMVTELILTDREISEIVGEAQRKIDKIEHT